MMRLLNTFEIDVVHGVGGGENGAELHRELGDLVVGKVEQSQLGDVHNIVGSQRARSLILVG